MTISKYTFSALIGLAAYIFIGPAMAHSIKVINKISNNITIINTNNERNKVKNIKSKKHAVPKKTYNRSKAAKYSQVNYKSIIRPRGTTNDLIKGYAPIRGQTISEGYQH